MSDSIGNEDLNNEVDLYENVDNYDDDILKMEEDPQNLKIEHTAKKDNSLNNAGIKETKLSKTNIEHRNRTIFLLLITFLIAMLVIVILIFVRIFWIPTQQEAEEKNIREYCQGIDPDYSKLKCYFTKHFDLSECNTTCTCVMYDADIVCKDLPSFTPPKVFVLVLMLIGIVLIVWVIICKVYPLFMQDVNYSQLRNKV